MASTPTATRIGILTPDRTVFKAISEELQETQDVVNGTSYYLTGELETTTGHYSTIILQNTNSSNAELAMETERLIQNFRPNIVLLLGLAGGIKDVELLDVVIGNKVYNFETGKVTDQGLVARPEAFMGSRLLIEKAKSMARQKEWEKRGMSVLVGPIASGEKLVASAKSDTFSFIKNNYNDAIALDMGTIGFATAVMTHKEVLYLNIRGISDLIASKHVSYEIGTQQKAAENVVAFSLALIRQLEQDRLENEGLGPRPAASKKIFTDANGTNRPKNRKKGVGKGPEQKPSPEPKPTPVQKPAEISNETSSNQTLNKRIHSDQWVKPQNDVLNYGIFAETICEILKDEDTKPPLAVAILAPWGQGKTSLMKLIQESFSNRETPKAKEKQDTETASGGKGGKKNKQGGKQSKYQLFKDWLKEDTFDFSPKLEYPTIWFNPWQYQSSNQIWAGMAHAIITQMVGFLPQYKQEEFWFKLQIQRVDRQALRLEIHKLILVKLLPWLIIFFCTAIIGAILIIKYTWAGASVLTLLTLPSLITGIFKYLRENGQSFVEKFGTLVKKPDYEKEYGLFHYINEDLRRVFHLLIDDKAPKPAIIFIDDLDRCSASKVVEVIEAINLMMNADLNHKCYFIIGMDAQMVAAALDVAYAKLQGKFDVHEKRSGSVGWYFLDKFIQLPFHIPTLSARQKKRFLQYLFSASELAEIKDMVDSVEANIRNAALDAVDEQGKLNANDLNSNLGSIVNNVQGLSDMQKLAFQIQLEQKAKQEATKKLVEKTKDSREIAKKVVEYSSYLSPSPREIKRFANLLRFYSIHQNLRNIELEQDEETPVAASLNALSKWLIITLRWPRLVRWIQWGSDNTFQIYEPTEKEEASFEFKPRGIRQNSAFAKAEFIDEMLYFAIDNSDNYEDAYELWKTMGQNNKHIPELGDNELFKLLYDHQLPQGSLADALTYDVW